MEETKKYEEESELPHPWEWVIIVLFSASIAAFGLLVYRVVPEGERVWDFGQLPDTPAESIFSTESYHPPTPVPLQIERLPERMPPNPPAPRNEPVRERGPRR